MYRLGLHRYTLLAVLLIAFTGLVTLVAPTDPDVWWHLRDGQLILNSGVPTTDVYSFTAYGRPWFAQEWLTEVVMYVVKSAFGYGVLSIVFGLLQALGGLLVYKLCRYMGAGRLLALLLLMLYTVFATPTWGVRPQVVTPALLGTFYLVLLAYRRDPSRVRLLWILPPMMLLWVNMHASYIVGMALLGVFVVGEAANNYIYRPERPTPIKPLLACALGCAVVTLANPYFVELWTYPLSYVVHGTGNPLLKYIQEWQSPNFREPRDLLFGISVVLLGVFGVTRPASEREATRWRFPLGARVDITEALLIAGFTLAAFQAIRFIPIYGLVALPVLARPVAAVWPALSRQRETMASAVEGRINWAVAVVAIVGAFVFLVNLPQAQTGQEPRTDTLFRYPAAAANYIDRVPGPGHMYNDFGWGGYLVYRLYPHRQVFIDGRADMYREGVFEDSIMVEGASPAWHEVLDRYQINYALTATGGPLDNALAHEPGWVVGHRDGVAVVYRKAN